MRCFVSGNVAVELFRRREIETVVMLNKLLESGTLHRRNIQVDGFSDGSFGQTPASAFCSPHFHLPLRGICSLLGTRLQVFQLKSPFDHSVSKNLVTGFRSKGVHVGGRSWRG